MSARGKHHRPARLHRRLLFGIVSGVIALVLVLEGGTGALFYQSVSPSTGSVKSAQEQLAISGSSSTITLTSAATVGYSPVVTLSNTGTSRNALPFVDTAVSVGTDSGSLQGKISVVWVTTTVSDCSTADYNHNVVLSATSLSLPSGARSIGGSGAPAINPSSSVKLCGQFTLTNTSATAGSTVTATFSFTGWDVSFESNTVSYSQTVTIGSTGTGGGQHVPPVATDCGKQYNGTSGVLNSYQFGWYYPYQQDNWTPSGYRVTFSGTPANLPASLNPTKYYPVTYSTGGSGQYTINVTNLDSLGTADIIGTFSVVGLDAQGNAATKPATFTFTAWAGGSSQGCTKAGS